MFDAHSHVSKADAIICTADGSLPVKPFYMGSIGFLPGFCQLDIIRLEKMLMENPGLGAGEIGLDRRYSSTVPLEKQLEFLNQALELAQRLKRPVTLHCVGYDGHMISAIEGIRTKLLWHRCQVSSQSALLLMKMNVFMSFRSCTQVGRLVYSQRPDLFLLESDSQTNYDFDLKGLYDSYSYEHLEERVYANAKVFTS